MKAVNKVMSWCKLVSRTGTKRDSKKANLTQSNKNRKL